MARRFHIPRACSIAATAFSAGWLALPGCSPKLGQAGRSSVAAAYTAGTLTTELGSEVSVLAAATAAERTLRARGYALTESTQTEDRARLVGSRVGHGPFEAAVIESWVSPNGTTIAVRIDPLGDESASYAILDDVLARLGR